MGLFDKFKKKEVAPTTLVAVASGNLLPMEASVDPVFSSKMMGDGYIIDPTENTIVSPINGTLQTLFPTLHAIAIVGDQGEEILIHVGMDTVNLNGEGFTAFVQEGDPVAVGQKLLEIDFSAIKDKVPSIAIPVVITNLENKTVTLSEKKTVSAGEEVLTIHE